MRDRGRGRPDRRSGSRPLRGLTRRGPVPGALLVVAAAWLYVFPYAPELNNPNERVRVLQARALVEHGRLAIGESVPVGDDRFAVRDLYGGRHAFAFVNDLSLVCRDGARDPPDCAGLLYPAKAPGTSLLGVPALAAARALGAVDAGVAGEGAATWWLRYGGVALPVLAGLWAVARLLARAGVGGGVAARVVLAAGLGSSLFPYGVSFVGHALAGSCLVGGILLLERAREAAQRVPAWSAGAGLVTGAAVLTEYPAVLAAACVGLRAVAAPERRRLLPGFAAGAAGAVVVLLVLQDAMFGGPFTPPHFHLMSAHNRVSQEVGFLGMDAFHAASLRDHLFDLYMGLLPSMPWLVAGAAVGLPLLLRGRAGALAPGAARSLATVPLVYLAFVATLANWRIMNGWSVGPRYLVPALPALAVAAGLGWQALLARGAWAGALVAGLAAAALVVVGALTVFYPSPPLVRSPFGELALPLLLEGGGVRSLGEALGLGRWSLLPFALLLAGAAVWIALPPDAVARRGRAAAPAALALAIAGVWVTALGVWTPTPPEVVEQKRAWLREHGDRPPDGGRPFWPAGR